MKQELKNRGNMSLTMDGSQDEVTEDEYSDELKELNRTGEILRQAIQEPLEEIKKSYH